MRLQPVTLRPVTLRPAPPPPALRGIGHVPRVGDAIITPFSDLNLAKAVIPQVLKEANGAPYVLPLDASCLKLIELVQALNAVLGADLDTLPSAANPSLIERSMGEVGNASVSALKNTAEGLLPLRGWIRKLTGAERHSRRVAAGITAGSIRRACLKGLGHAKECAPPAAPVVFPAVSAPPRP